MLQIAGKPVWWIILFIIPIVNFIIAILLYLELLKKITKPGISISRPIHATPISAQISQLSCMKTLLELSIPLFARPYGKKIVLRPLNRLYYGQCAS